MDKVQTYATCGPRLASGLGKANGQSRQEEAGDRELHVCKQFCVVVMIR